MDTPKHRRPRQLLQWKPRRSFNRRLNSPSTQIIASFFPAAGHGFAHRCHLFSLFSCTHLQPSVCVLFQSNLVKYGPANSFAIDSVWWDIFYRYRYFEMAHEQPVPSFGLAHNPKQIPCATPQPEFFKLTQVQKPGRSSILTIVLYIILGQHLRAALPPTTKDSKLIGPSYREPWLP